MADRGTHSPTINFFKKRAKTMSDEDALAAGRSAGMRKPSCNHATKLHIAAKEAGFTSWEALRLATEEERRAAVDRAVAERRR